MSTPETKRKLTAILSADVKGYHRLIAKDEAGTLQTLNTYKEAMASLIQHHHGRVVDTRGDNVLAEFVSVGDAVECGIEIQRELRARNDKLPLPHKMEFRIGINLGDVLEEENKIFGDGVNIVARMQSLADGGGLCISGIVYDQVKNKMALKYEYLGKQRIKNIVGPVKAYRVMIEPETLGSVVSRWKRAGVNYWKRVHPAFKILIALVAAGNALWQLYPRMVSPPVGVAPKDEIEVASKMKMAFPLPDKPSIAVLPFVNMSEDPKQEYFADGITEEIITALSKVPRLFVIARNSTSTYKGKSVKVKQVAEELGIRYVLEGSVRKTGDKVRITAQLIDALAGHHLWAERYDRDLKDIFALQDEITLKITTALQVKLTTGEQARLIAKGTKNLEAYLKALQCREYGQRMTKEGNAAARKLAEEIIALDPKFPFAYVALALNHHMDIVLGLSESPQQSVARAIELAKKAISLDNSYSVAHSVLGLFYVMYKREYEMGIAEAERAVALDPNSAENLVFSTFVLCHAGRPEEAIPLIESAERLNPIPLPLQLVAMGLAYRLTGRYEKAIEADKRAIRVEPNNQLAHVDLIASCIASGREKEARAEAAELLKIDPNFSVDLYMKRRPYKNQVESDRLVDALYKAGLK